MQISPYKFVLNNASCVPPERKGWERMWHGFYHLIETKTDEIRIREAMQQSTKHYTAFDLEKFTLMSILEELGSVHVNLFELGCGRAPWCLALAGAIKYGFVPNPPSSYRILAVEAEPTHFLWAKKHLSKQNISGDVVHGAVSSCLGSCRFTADTDPAAHMGQAISSEGNIEVPTLTIDYLRSIYSFDKIHVLHMDIQGQELEALIGAQQTLEKGLIDYIIIGSHGILLETTVKKQLELTHDLVIELPTLGEKYIDGIGKPFKSFDDGVLVFKSKKTYNYAH